MKRFIKFLSLCSIIMLTVLTIGHPTNAKYVYNEIGNAGYHNFSKFEIFAEEFVIREEDFDPATGEIKSENLWGGGEPHSSSDISNIPSQYQIQNVQDVSFGVRNSSKVDIALSSFEYTIFMKSNSDYELKFSVINMVSSNDAYNIVCNIQFNRSNLTCPQITSSYLKFKNGVDIYDEVTGEVVDNVSGKNTGIVGINPLDYYKNVTVSGTFENPKLDIAAKDGTINDIEKRIIETYYVLVPGQVFEYNLKVELADKGNQASIKQSVYSTIKMYAKKYNPEVDIVTANL